MAAGRRAFTFSPTPSCWPFWRLALAFTGVGGPLYLAVAVVLNALFLSRDRLTSGGGTRPWPRPMAILVEKKFFKLSLLYLFAHFGAIAFEAALAP